MHRLFRFFLLGAGCLIFPWVLLGQTRDRVLESKPADKRLRRPVALALAEAGTKLLVANRESGTIAVLDTNTLQVLGETQVGRKISDMALHPAGDLLLVTDEDSGEVVWVQYRAGSLRAIRRLAVGVSPVSVRITGAGDVASVACLWQRRLRILDLAALSKNRGKEETFILDLPFAPRRQVPVPGTDKLIVADAFAGKLAVVDLRRHKIDSVRDLGVHNIRGLALDPRGQGLWLTHQVLHARGHTTSGDIRTGNLLTNNVRRLSLVAVLDPMADVQAK